MSLRAPLLALALLCVAQPAAADKRADLGESVMKMTTDLSCETNEQCKFIGFGDKACGGFQSYKLYSTKTTDEASLTSIVNEYNALDKKFNTDNGMASTCDMAIEPAVSCVEKICKVVASGSGLSPGAY